MIGRNSIITNPGKLGHVHLKQLLTALKADQCKWVKFTPAQLAIQITDNKACQAHDKIMYKSHKHHSGLSSKQNNNIISDNDSNSSTE
ncbi:hypothetical protein JVU11DRAFT_2548 [Chiua virens]|nr:hypothetical protein JVU11DRAFT_2548 [Chiua virens]